MPRVGRIVTNPRTGAYCRVLLDSGEKVVVAHDGGGAEAALLQAILAWLTRGAGPGTLAPLGAGIEFVRAAATLGELRARGVALTSIR